MTKEELIKFIADNDITIAKHTSTLTRWLTRNINDEWIVYDAGRHIYTGNFDNALQILVKE
jgi:hypothetical protein